MLAGAVGQPADERQVRTQLVLIWGHEGTFPHTRHEEAGHCNMSNVCAAASAGVGVVYRLGKLKLSHSESVVVEQVLHCHAVWVETTEAVPRWGPGLTRQRTQCTAVEVAEKHRQSTGPEGR